MKNILTFFDNLGEYVYASDTETYEILYMNAKTLEHFGYSSTADVKGKKCYEIFQGCSQPCAVCSNKELSVGDFREWRHFAPRFGKRISQKDTLIELDGRLVRVEIAFEAERSANDAEDLNVLVNEGLRVALMADTPEKSLMVELEYIGKLLNAERTYIFEKQESGCDSNTYEWTAAGVTPEIDSLQALPPEVCSNWYDVFSEGNSIIIENIEDIRESEPVKYDILKRQNIHSIVVVPLYENGKAIGFYGVDNPPTQKIDATTGILQIMGQFIIATLKRRDLVKELERMSFTDQLTGLGNRHSMTAFIEENISKVGKIGILYCDITGLKSKNDRSGHKEGDLYIMRAGDCLKSAFEGFGLFRIGGDELLALCPEIDESDFNDRINVLKERLKENSVTMAIGALYETSGEFDIDDLLCRSEALMYKDKDIYYRTSGVDRRKR